MGSYTQVFPRAEGSSDITVFSITAWKLKQQNLNPRDPNYIMKGPRLYHWNLIGFQDISESIVHNWEPYDTITGRINEMISTEKSNFTQITQVIGGGVSGLTSNNFNAVMRNALNNTSTEGAKYKVDTPLVYTGSQRRQISLTFSFQTYRDPEEDVVVPIHNFRKYSCAGIDGESVDKIDFPAIFEIMTVPSGIVNIRDAALTDVQVTWNSPHKNGNPMRAELTVTFLDLRPLYKSSWGTKEGNIISTSMR